MSSLNKVQLIGRTGNVPEIRTTQSGKKVANFSLATSETWKDKSTGQKQEKTEWHKLTCFSDGLVGVIESYVKKGDRLYVEGKLQTLKWQGNDGKDNYTTSIVIDSLIMLGEKRESQGYNQQQPSQQQVVFQAQAPIDAFDDNVPF